MSSDLGDRNLTGDAGGFTTVDELIRHTKVRTVVNSGQVVLFDNH